MNKYTIIAISNDNDLIFDKLSQIIEIENITSRNDVSFTFETKYIRQNINEAINEIKADIEINRIVVINENVLENLLIKINRLPGNDEFKKIIDEIKNISLQIHLNNTYRVFFSYSYLLSIDDGCGASTLMTYLKEVIEATVLYPYSYDEIKEYEIKNLNCIDNLIEDLSVINRGRFIVFDIVNIMEKVDSYDFRSFLNYLRDHQNNNIFVFRVPYIEPGYLNNIYNQIDNILNLKSIVIPPLSKEEIKAYASKFIKQYHFEINDDFWSRFFKVIVKEKSDGRFYGIETVEKVVNEILYEKQLTNYQNNTNDKVIDASLIKPEDYEFQTGKEMLEKIVGLNDIKTKISDIITAAKNEKETNIKKSTKHMAFYGNPGTGKTTIARIVAKMMSEAGVLTDGDFIEINARELCGEHIGETAPKTARICREAYGSVLFIDEAYSLFENNNSKDYGREALNTLVSEMENNRDNLIVIFAGYKDKLEETINSNPGLKGRIPYQIYFDNYSRDELFEIFMTMVKDNNFECNNEFQFEVKKLFSNMSDDFLNDKTFSNGRFVRNLFERTYNRALLRIDTNDIKKIELLTTDLLDACQEEEFKQLNHVITRNLIS